MKRLPPVGLMLFSVGAAGALLGGGAGVVVVVVSFEVADAEAYRRDVPGAEVHVIDAGHFALDEAPDLVADLTGKFLDAMKGATTQVL